MSRLHRFRRLPALLFIAAYLSITAFYLGRHAVGDASGHPFSYFWTWDMFPNYGTESKRQWAVGETASGEFVKLAPHDRHRFRWGVHGDATRLDVDRRRIFLRQAALDGVERYNASSVDDRVRHVYLAEQYWPAKFNLPGSLYRSFYRDETTGEVYWASAAKDNVTAKRVYWRVLEEAAIDAEGNAAAWEALP